MTAVGVASDRERELIALALCLAERIYLAHEVLGRLAERKRKVRLPRCLHCQSERRKGRPRYRGLCYRCHADPTVRDQYPRQPRGFLRPDTPPEKRCRHCQHPKRIRIRGGTCYGLCSVCYFSEVRSLYRDRRMEGSS